MAKKEDELLELISSHELEKKAREDNKLNDLDAQKFVESIMTNYFLDNDNINFLEDKGISYFTFSIKEDCFCISGKKFGDCCFNKLEQKVDKDYVPYIKALASEDDYKNYVEKLNRVFNEETVRYIDGLSCHVPGCDKNAVENQFYHEVDLADFKTTRVFNPFDARYKMGDVFFKECDEKTFKYFGFCEEHFNIIKELYKKPELDDNDILTLSLETIVYKLFFTMIQFKATHREYLKWYNSVEEQGYKAYMTVHMRKVSSNLKGIFNIFKIVTDNISKNTFTKLKTWKVELPKAKNFWCHDLVEPQITPDDFKVVNSVNNVLRTKNFIVQCMRTVGKKTEVLYVYDKLDENTAAFIKQFQLKALNKKTSLEHFVSNVSLILSDNILLATKWFEKLNEQEQQIYSALNKFRFDQPDIGREYIKMQFFAGFDRGNNFF